MGKVMYLKPSSARHTSYPILPRREKKFRKKQLHSAMGSQSYTSTPIQYFLVDRVTLYPNGGSPSVQTNTAYWKTAGMNASKTFINNVDWELKIKQRLDATSNYSRSGGKAVGVSIKGDTYIAPAHGSGRYDVYKVWMGAPMIENNDDNSLKDIALARLKHRLDGHIGGMSLLPPLVEAREIHGLVRQINGYLLETVQELMRIKRTRGKSIIRHASKTWLALGFGVNPLLADIAKLANSIEDYKSRTDHMAYVYGTASKEWVSTALLSNLDLGTSYVVADIYGRAYHQLSYRYKGAANLKIRSAAYYGVQDHLGLKLGQLPSAAWELTPFSWAVDYFTTVGAWLDDVFFTLPGNLVYLVLNKRYQNEVTQFPKVRIVFPNYRWVGRDVDDGYNEYYSFSRTKLSSLPTRQLRLKSVDEVAKYGLTKVLNLASVLGGGLSNRRNWFKTS